MIWLALLIGAGLVLIEATCVVMLVVSVLRLVFWLAVFLVRLIQGVPRCLVSSD